MTEIQEDSKRLVDKIYSTDYYVAQFEQALGKSSMTRQGISRGDLSDQALVSLWNTFWYNLPNTPTIRRAPFYELCDLAEHIFDEEDD